MIRYIAIGVLVLAVIGLLALVFWPEPPTPKPFDPSTCSAYDPDSGNPLDQAASLSQGKCVWSQVAPVQPTEPVVNPTQPVINPTAPVTVSVSSWTPAQKCEWLRSNFPQTTEAVQALGAQLANVQTQRVRTHLYPCSGTVTVFDGFIVLGPNEGYSGEVSMAVPPHGAIDSYVGASFTGRNQQIGENTVRGFDGIVSGVSMTYWPWHDEDPPIGGSLIPTSSSCEQPADLATRIGWQNPTLVDPTYGGVQVELVSASTLPPLWEALSSGRSIKETDSDRTMVLGVWTIYPPFACREQLGYSK